MPDPVLNKINDELSLIVGSRYDFRGVDSSMNQFDHNIYLYKEYSEGELEIDQVKEILSIRKLVSTGIADYIASMTDNHAYKEYSRLFEVMNV